MSALRVLVVSPEPVGPVMAGPAIRYLELARCLADRFAVTLVAPIEQPAEVRGVPVAPLPRGPGGLVRLARAHDAVFAPPLAPDVMVALARSPVRVVYDLYVPLVSEAVALLAGEPGSSGGLERRLDATRLGYRLALACGDAFVCASDRQRDLWLGVLSEAGRLTVEEHRRDPTFRELIDVVPFGLPDEPLPAGGDAASPIAGVGPGDRVVLWGGGVWNWLDPLTVIRAVARLAQERDDAKLVFMGLAHPSPRVPAMAMAAGALELARQLGVEGRSVLFEFGWTSYEDRVGLLRRADLGVTAHLDGIEARFAYRTRVLDYLWAGLPIVASRGDVLADLVDAHRLGRTVAVGDVDGWVDAISGLLDAPAEHAAARDRIATIRGSFAWSSAAERLARVLQARPPSALTPRGARALRAHHAVAQLGAAVAERGVGGTAAHVVRRAVGR